MIKRIIKGIRNPKKILLFLLNLRLSNFIPDKIYLKIKFYLLMGKKLDLENPKTFNEKLQWLKIYDHNPKYSDLVDKYEVRQYISKILGEDYLIPLIGVYNSYDEIDFDSLPNQFVLKPNHTSGDIFICKNKNDINHEALKKEINKWIKREYYWLHREWPYKNIEPKIICEKLIIDESGEDLKDYKVMCFNGEPKCIFVCIDRHTPTGLKINFYDTDWNLMPFKRHYPNSEKMIAKPKNFEKMIEFSKVLSRDFPFVRVDFYEVNDHLYFGELTFYPGAGFEEFEPEEYDKILGDWIKLPFR